MPPNQVCFTMRFMKASAKEHKALKSKEQNRHAQAKYLERYLDVSEKLEDDLVSVEDARMSGTCEWLPAKTSYLKWRSSDSDAPNILWIKGKPAAGKSILAGYVIDQLRNSKADCSYFFFKHGDKSKSRLSACLRSLAYQMACSSTQVLQVLSAMQIDNAKIDNENERTLWRKLFKESIFQTNLSSHFWVIDALDECSNYSSFFDSMLAQIDKSVNLRILITSRETPELKKHFLGLGGDRILIEKITTEDTLPDIKLLVEANATSVLVNDDGDRANLVGKIVGKAEGSFLWTVLVLNELTNSYGEQAISRTLEDVPRGMGTLYQRTLDLMSNATGGKELAKAILTWATSTTRPLTARELDGALNLDMRDKFPKSEESIAALCGQLVTVDKFGKVQMIHETAREFLLSKNLNSEFAVQKTDAHTRIARACLIYLTGDEMKPPRNSRRGSVMRLAPRKAEFSVYACAAFSYHLAKADPLAKDIFALVGKFLKSNVLSWIEIIAQKQNLNPLIRAARNLKTYLDLRTAVASPLGKSMQLIRGWTTDLIRIVAKFANALIKSPSAIYSLILPLCPTESTVHKTAISGRKLSVVGLSNAQWDDRLSCIDFYEGQTSAVCYGDEFLAVGLTSGMVALYHAMSCQQYKVLNHGEAVKILQFRRKSGLMASCGMKRIRIWDILSGETIHSFQAPQRFIGLVFDENLLMAASSKNYLASWDLDNNGAQRPDRPWTNSTEQDSSLSRLTPCAISISIGHKMLAVAYNRRPIKLWDFEEDAYFGSCGMRLENGETSTHMVTALVLNPNPNIGLLAASYLDGELVILDPFDDHEIEKTRANCHTLAASPDGRLLAGGAGGGIIQVYEFDTLRLLYRVKSSNFFIKQLAFSSDNIHVSDIRGSHCNVWEPTVLLRDSLVDDSSEGTLFSAVDVVASDTKLKISAMALHPKGDYVFCGKVDGSICLYDVKAGALVRTLYKHRSLVRLLTCWPQSDLIMSVDASNGIFAWSLEKAPKTGWVAEKMLFRSRLDSGKPIIQVLPGGAAGKFLLSTRNSDHLWTTDGQQEAERRFSGDKPVSRKWVHHPQSPLYMICIEGIATHIYAWSDWSEISSITLTTDLTGQYIKSITPYTSHQQTLVLLELSDLNGSATTNGLHLLDAASFSIDESASDQAVAAEPGVAEDTGKVRLPDEAAAATSSNYDFLLAQKLAAFAHVVAHVVGLSDTNRLVFLDAHSWVCSVDIKSVGNNLVSYSRHFFVPYDWFAGTRDMICAVVKQDVLFARNDDIAVIKGGLEYFEEVNMKV